MTRTASPTAHPKRMARNRRRRDLTRIEILDTAREVLLRDGLAALTLGAVTDELGLTKPALYYYFDSKEALLLEVLLREWMEGAAEVQAAVETTDSGADAVETMMRTVFDRYRNRLEIFVLFFMMGPGGAFDKIIGPEEIDRFHPANHRLYGGAEARLAADQRCGRFPQQRDPRRFAFTAHMAVIGLLNMLAIVAATDDPLIHNVDDLIDDLCLTFRNATFSGETP